MTATGQTVSGVPGRYAGALFDLAREEKAVDQVGRELAAFGDLIEQSPDLARLVRSPVFSADNQLAALETVTAQGGMSDLTLNFIRLVARNRRLPAISEMIRGYAMLAAAAKGEVQAEVTSAEKLLPKHVDELKAALKASIGRDVQLSLNVDPSLLGGLVVRVGSRMLDNSLRTKLANLKIAMKGTA